MSSQRPAVSGKPRPIILRDDLGHAVRLYAPTNDEGGWCLRLDRSDPDQPLGFLLRAKRITVGPSVSVTPLSSSITLSARDGAASLRALIAVAEAAIAELERAPQCG